MECENHDLELSRVWGRDVYPRNGKEDWNGYLARGVGFTVES